VLPLMVIHQLQLVTDAKLAQGYALDAATHTPTSVTAAS